MGQNQSLPPPRAAQVLPSRPKITVLSAGEAREALEKAERKDFFRSDVESDPVNRAAREGLDYVPLEGPDLPIDVSWLSQDIQICWMSPSAEAGMPHTREESLVCLPLYWSQGQLLETLKHEAVHIDQRKRPMEWVKWCTNQGWTLVDEKDIPERWRRVCRINPDTMKFRFWAYKNRWVPLPMYEREDRPKLREVQIRWWDRKTGELLVHPPAELQELIVGVLNPEHPFEIAAYQHVKI
jgi:hypothetical protein